MKEFVNVMKALSDANRVKIVKLLQERVLCVCEIRSLLGVAQPTVSKHLKILEGAGLVASRKNGLWVDYFLTEAEGNSYSRALLENMEGWLGDDPEIRELQKKLPSVSRDEICKK